MNTFRTKTQNQKKGEGVTETEIISALAQTTNVTRKSLPRIAEEAVKVTPAPRQSTPEKKPPRPLDSRPRKISTTSSPAQDTDYVPRLRREKRLTPKLPPLTPASQWYKDEH